MTQTQDVAQPGYVILTNKHKLEADKLVFEKSSSAKDVVKIKYEEGGAPRTIYLQSASCTLRSPLIYDGELQKAVDVDLWESLCKRNAEFVAKIGKIEDRTLEFLKSDDKHSTEETANRLLKSSLRVLQKAKAHHLPTFRVITDGLVPDEDVHGRQGDEVADLDHNTRVQIIVELVGLKVTKHNGRGTLVWKLAQLKVLPDVKETTVAQSKLPKGVAAFLDDDDVPQRAPAVEVSA